MQVYHNETLLTCEDDLSKLVVMGNKRHYD